MDSTLSLPRGTDSKCRRNTILTRFAITELDDELRLVLVLAKVPPSSNFFQFPFETPGEINARHADVLVFTECNPAVGHIQ